MVLRRLFGSRPKVMPTPIRTLEAFEQQVVGGPLPTIVDVWSPSCAPCRKLATELIGVATKYAGRVQVVEVSTGAEPALLSRLQVQATPTIIVFNDGQELGRSAGFRPGAWFDGLIEAEFPEKGQKAD